jgi:predicted protein tyrosine phosphatase
MSDKSQLDLQELDETDHANITKVFDRMYISGINPLSVIDPDALSKFSLIISITEKPIPSLREFAKTNDIEYLQFTSKDSIRSRINRHFPNTYDAILPHYIKHDDRNILIHCMEGKSRSVTILIAFLLKYLSNYCESIDKEKNNTDMLLHNIKLKRPVAQPNPAFMKALYNYEKELLNSCAN